MIYEERKCPVCSVYFVPKKKNQIYCGKKCSDKAYKKRVRERKFVKRTEKEKATCVVCGEEFIKKNARQIMCGSKDCKLIYLRKYQKKKKEEELKMVVDRTCIICGKKFITNAHSKIDVCSKKCNSEKRKQNKMCRSADIIPVRKTRKPKTSLAEINRLAREEHLTYGEYVTKYGL